MRISTGQIFTNASNSMMDNQTSLLDIQDKMSSGKQFTRLADDPVGASQVVSLKRELAQLEMFNTNIDASRRRLELEETTLGDLNTAQDRMRELVVYAANGVLSDADRAIIATELEELVEYSAGLMNTRDAKGEYLFSGSQGNIQTYAQTGSRYTYQGDASNRDIQVSSALYVQSTDNGRYLFESITDEPTLKATGALRSALGEESVNVTDVDAFEAFMRTAGDLSVEVDQYVDGGGTTVSTYTLRDSTGKVVLDTNDNPLQGIAFTNGNVPGIELPGATVSLDLAEPIAPAPSSLGVYGPDSAMLDVANVSSESDFLELMRETSGDISIGASFDEGSGQYTYEVTDQAGNVLATATGAANQTVNLGGPPAVSFDLDMSSVTSTAAAAFAVDTPATSELKLQFEQPPTNILNAVMETVELMREPVEGTTTAKTELNDRFALMLDQLNQSQERLSEATSTLGARINKLDKAELSNTDFQLMTESTLSAVQDLDYAAASTELAKRKLSLEATYASFTQIKDLSLFNYIR
ncbi:flagellar hook-associated protein FlgL [Nitrincola sp.]|uniref:flagellar hook-associated protein FlgL n=1 Tax=Nitrincola sp. TaxID=1926584 RepID=UPI003A946223